MGYSMIIQTMYASKNNNNNNNNVMKYALFTQYATIKIRIK